MRKVRLSEVAADAGVSVATVTRVIRSSGPVSDEKRKSVEASVVRLGYVIPNPQSRRPLPEARIIGHILRKASNNQLFARILDSVNDIAGQYGYHVISITVDDGYSLNQLVDHINALCAYNARGIIMSALGDTADFEPIKGFLGHLPVPVVMIERVAEIMGISKVILNARESLYMATRHLIHVGHRRIAYLAPDWHSEVERQRLRGYRDALPADRADEQDLYIPCKLYSVEEGYRAVAQFAQHTPLPTALIANDALLSGVQQYLYEHKLRVPSYMSMIGTDDTLARASSPPITSLAFPENDMARTAIDLILNAVMNPETLTRTVSLSTTLIKRDSVAVPRKETA
jgi:DNA-binding LacI/PurR family transcriptional regulator